MSNKHKRNKGLLVLVLPLIVAVFLVGWFMYVVGQRGSGVASKDSKPKGEFERFTFSEVPVVEEASV